MADVSVPSGDGCATAMVGGHVLQSMVKTMDCGGSAATVALRRFVAAIISLSTVTITCAAAHASMEMSYVASAIEAARRYSLDPRVFLAIGWHESHLDPWAGPPVHKGRPMSSASGMWQILAAPDTLKDLGLSKADRTNYARATPAMAQYLSRQQDRLRQMGIDPTPGRIYMTWNVGPGMALAIMNSEPSETIERIANRMLAKYGQQFITKWLHNNPSLYRPGMTAGQIAANYELQMAKDMRAVDPYLAAGAAG